MGIILVVLVVLPLVSFLILVFLIASRLLQTANLWPRIPSFVSYILLPITFGVEWLLQTGFRMPQMYAFMDEPSEMIVIFGPFYILACLPAILGSVHLYRYLKEQVFHLKGELIATVAQTPPPDIIEQRPTGASEKFVGFLRVPPSLVPAIKLVFEKHHGHLESDATEIEQIAGVVNRLAGYLGDYKMIEFNTNGKTWRSFITTETFYRETGLSLLKTMTKDLLDIPIMKVIPPALRTEHHQILASIGHGKSQCIINMVLDDLDKDVSIVVIDSQRDLIDALVPRIPADRLILVDPETCPPALNIFDGADVDERTASTAIELYEYIFSALEANLTSKQSLVYRNLSRLCMTIPGANIETMRDMLKPGGTEKEQYTLAIAKLSDNAKAFFAEFQLPKGNQFSETRQEVLRRLLQVLDSPTMSRMLASKQMKLNIGDAIDEGKVILISTDKSLLKGGSSLFGRIFMAQIMQAVMQRRGGQRKRTYLYIDEFADYAEDSRVLLDLFEQSRKYELGLIVCHQNLSQLSPKLAATMSTSTHIKFVGGLSAQDSRVMASQMRTEHETIDAQKKGSFLAYFKGIGVMPWAVDFGRIDRTPKITDRSSVEATMRRLYGADVKQRRGPEPEEDFNEAF